MAAGAADSRLPTIPAGKPGLYELSGSTNGSILRGHGAGDLPEKELKRLADEALAQSVPAFRFCHEDGEAKPFEPTSIIGSGCTYANVVKTKNGYSAEARCAVGERVDIVHLTAEADTPEHHKVTLSISLPGTSISLITRYETNWISSDCGDIPSGAGRTTSGKIIALPKP
jgi:hypothetical protein